MSMTSMGAINIKFFDSIFPSQPPLLFGIRQTRENECNRYDFYNFIFYLKSEIWTPKFYKSIYKIDITYIKG